MNMHCGTGVSPVALNHGEDTHARRALSYT